MAATAARSPRVRPTPAAPSAATPPPPTGEDAPAARGDARLHGLDYAAWLLPPLPPTSAERVVHTLSVAAGPSAFVAFALAVGPRMF